MLRNRARLALVGTAGGAVVLGAALLGGHALAQTGGSPTTPQQRQQTYINNVLAGLPGTNAQTLYKAILNADIQQVNQQLANPNLNTQQKQRLQALLTRLQGITPGSPAPWLSGGGFGFGFGPGGPGHAAGPRNGHRGAPPTGSTGSGTTTSTGGSTGGSQ